MAVILGSGEVMSNMYLYLCFSIFFKDPRVYKNCFYNKKIIKETACGLMCFNCKYFADYMTNLKLVMLSYLNKT